MKVIYLWLLTMIVLLTVAEGRAVDNRANAAQQTEADTSSTKTDKHSAYVQVALWDVSTGKSEVFESGIRKHLLELENGSDFVNARVLKNMSDLNLQYATYVRYASRTAAEDSLAKQVALLGPFCWRTPETHLIRLERAYFPSGIADLPAGTEFAISGTGQIAHLGLWVPYPNYRKEYDKVLDEVKRQTWEQHNPGYIGEEIGNEVEALSPEQQTPYSPHPGNAEAMSINYGEFKTFEEAEKSFLAHTGDRLAWTWWRVFFASLQVPTRFYIFQVVQSYGHLGTPSSRNRQEEVRSLAKR